MSSVALLQRQRSDRAFPQLGSYHRRLSAVARSTSPRDVENLIGLLIAFGGACSVHAQLASTTSLVGNIIDSSGAAMTGVSLTATNQGTNESYAAVTNSSGYYEIRFVKVGTFNITAEKAGFAEIEKAGVIVEENQIVRTDFTMQVGQVSQTLTVTATTPPIVTDDPTISETVSLRATEDLPLNGRDSLRLATVTPTVLPGLKNPAANPGGGEDFIAAGTREVQNTVSLDGISIMNNLISTSTLRPSVDAIQEVQVQTGTYPAEYGDYMGLQLNLFTKTGTNDLHGSVSEFVRNNWFDARGFYNHVGTARRLFIKISLVLSLAAQS